MGLDITALEPALKKYYTSRRLELLAYLHQPTLRLLSKNTGWTGNGDYDMPIWHETGQAVGHDFTTVMANKAISDGAFDKFTLSQSDIYGVASISRKALKMAKGERAYLTAYTTAVDGALKSLGRDIAMKVFRTRASVRSSVASTGSTLGSGIVKLANREDHIHFHVNMKCVFSDAGGAAGATLNAAGAAYFVVAVNRSAGLVTFSLTKGGLGADLTSPASGDAIAAGDFIHRDADVTSSSNTLGIAGFEEWIPDTAPGSTLFYGVNRAVDTDKLGGLRLDAKGLRIVDALQDAGSLVFEQDQRLTHFVMHPSRWNELQKELGSQVVRDEKASQRLGVAAVKVQSGPSEVTCYADPLCQVDRIWGLDETKWELVSCGPLPEVFEEDMRMLRESDSDGYEVRMGGYGQLGCHVPGANINIQLA